MSFFINRVTLTGYLTGDPELGCLPSGLSVCVLSLASSVRRRSGRTGRWYPKRNRFEVLVFGRNGERVAQRMRAGQLVAIDGQLDWRPVETKSGERIDRVSVIAGTVQFLGSSSPAPTAQASGPADDRQRSAPSAPASSASPCTGADPAIRTDAASSSGGLPAELATLDFELFAEESTPE